MSIEVEVEDYSLLEDLVAFIFESLCSEPDSVSVYLDSIPREQIKVTVVLDNPDLLGHILGRKYVNIRSVLQIIRSQQIIPHDRYIRVIFEDTKGQEIASFLNTDVSAYRKNAGDDYNFEYHQLRVESRGSD